MEKKMTNVVAELKKVTDQLGKQGGIILEIMHEKTSNREKDVCMADYKRISKAISSIGEILKRETKDDMGKN